MYASKTVIVLALAAAAAPALANPYVSIGIYC